MGLESVFKLSLIMNMIDNLTSPMARVMSSVDGGVSKLQNVEQKFGSLTKTGAVVAGVGMQLTDAVLKPIEATFATQQALGELSTLGVKDLGAVEDAATSFSNKWAGTTKDQFITAAYDIKSGINSLSDEGVAQYTSMAGLTAKATKSTISEMTSLFASGYNIYKGFYKDLSDQQFGALFSAGISQSVKQFKTTGSGMANAIRMLGASATTAKVPLEEQLSVLGMLQSTMSGEEAGTKYKAFVKQAASAGKELGLSFLDANNQLLSLPQILDKLHGKFGETMDAAEKMQLQKAFGDEEAVSLIDLMYDKTGYLQNNITGMYGALGKGTGVAKEMANDINNMAPDKFQVLKQKIDNTVESIGNQLLPDVNEMLAKGNDILTWVSGWIGKHQELTKSIMLVIAGLGVFLTVAGTFIAVIGSVGLVVTRTAGFFTGLWGALTKLPGMFQTIYIKALYAGDGIKGAFSTIGSLGSKAAGGIKTAATAVADFGKQAAIGGANGLKSFATGVGNAAKSGAELAVSLAKTAAGFVKMGAEAAASAVKLAVQKGASLAASAAQKVQAATQWLVNAAMNANPVGFIIAGIAALIVIIVLLATHWQQVITFIQGAWAGFVNGIAAGFNWIRNLFAGMPLWLQIALAVFTPFIGIPMLIINHWGQISTFFQNLWNGIADGAKAAVNFVIGALDGLHFTVPAWVPGIGGSNFGFNIPKLATGGIVDEATPFIAGEHGREAVMPLENNTGWIDNLAQSLSHKIVPFPQRPVKKVNLDGKKTGGGRTVTTEKSKGTTIQKLVLQVDFSKIKDLPQLFKLLKEIEDITNANGGQTDETGETEDTNASEAQTA